MNNDKRTVFIVLAGGVGRRFAGGRPKQFALLNGVPVLIKTLSHLIGDPGQYAVRPKDVVVVALAGHLDDHRRLLDDHGYTDLAITAGGERRQDSVRRGLDFFAGQDVRTVVIHDGVRPFVRHVDVGKAILTMGGAAGIIFAVLATDTIKTAALGTITGHLDRSAIWLAQTPQIFDYAKMRLAAEAAHAHGLDCTDDAAVMAVLGETVRIYPYTAQNIKVTCRFDLDVAALIDRQMNGSENSKRT